MLLVTLISSAMALDPGAWQQVLSASVDSRGNVNYAAVHAAGVLDGYLAGLAQATEPSARAEKMAFWINAYNALTVDLVADNWPLRSIRDLDGGDPWGTRSFTVAGRQVTLNDIEHKILRPMGDARIHAAVNCASRGCPPLARQAFTGAALDAQLDAVAQSWVRGSGARVDPATGTVTLSRIFEWYGEDFVASYGLPDVPGIAGKQEAAANFVARYWPDQAAYLHGGGYTVAYSTYDWSVNAQ
jgi:hypothetical protein